MAKRKVHPAFGTLAESKKVLRQCKLLDYPVTVRVKEIPEEEDKAAYTEFCHKKKRFKIYIEKSLSEDAQVLLLLHEWAHAMAWECMEHPELEEEDHNVSFGIAYGLVIRYFFDQVPSKYKIH